MRNHRLTLFPDAFIWIQNKKTIGTIENPIISTHLKEWSLLA